VKPKSKESGTQGKFVPICHYCGKIGHIRPNCYLLCCDKTNIPGSPKKQKNSIIANNHNTNSRDTKN
jgi:hypothetical protein